MKLNILLFVSLIASLASPAQKMILSVGNSPSMLIKSGTVFSADSLVLIPGADFALASNTIQETATPVPFNPSPSIERVYYLASPVVFTGTMDIYYRPSELNGDVESALFLTDSTAPGVWTSEMTSTVNTTSHFVQLVASSHSFNAATASPVLIPLPLELISFSGAWSGNDVVLEWVIQQAGEAADFDVQSSPDGARWKDIGTVPGPAANSLISYDFTDNDPSSNMMFYRIKITQASGQFSYSYIVRVQKDNGSNDIRMIVNNNALSVYFMGTQPSAIRLINTSGMILKVDHTSRREYDLNGLSSGVYFLQYEINGQWGVREFLIQ